MPQLRPSAAKLKKKKISLKKKTYLSDYASIVAWDIAFKALKPWMQFSHWYGGMGFIHTTGHHPSIAPVREVIFYTWS